MKTPVQRKVSFFSFGNEYKQKDQEFREEIFSNFIGQWKSRALRLAREVDPGRGRLVPPVGARNEARQLLRRGGVARREPHVLLERRPSSGPRAPGPAGVVVLVPAPPAFRDAPVGRQDPVLVQHRPVLELGGRGRRRGLPLARLGSPPGAAEDEVELRASQGTEDEHGTRRALGCGNGKIWIGLYALELRHRC